MYEGGGVDAIATETGQIQSFSIIMSLALPPKATGKRLFLSNMTGY